MRSSAWLGRIRAFGAETRETLRETPHLGWLVAANLVSAFNTGLLVPVLPLYILARGFSLVQLGGLFSLVAVSTVGVQLLAGRYPRFFARPPVVFGLLIVSAFALPAYLFVDSALQVLAIMALSSFAGGAAGPGMQVLLADLAPPKRRATFFAYLGVAWSFSYAAALVVGGALLALGYAAVFYVGSLFALLSVTLLAVVFLPRRIRRRRTVRLAGATGAVAALADEADALRAELRDWGPEVTRARRVLEGGVPPPPLAVRNVQLAAVYLFLFGVSLAIYPVYFPRYLLDLGLPVGWVGVVVASSWVTFGLAQPLGARYADRTGRHRQVIVASLLCAAVLNFVMAIAVLPLVILAWILLGIADGIGRPLTSALVAGSVTRAGRGFAFGFTQAADTTARILAPFGLAFAIQGAGIAQGLVVVGALVALAALPAAGIRELLPEPSPAPAATGGGA